MNELKIAIREIIKDIVYAFVLSIILFYITIPKCKVYLIIFSVIWILILLGYGNRKNREFLFKMICFTTGNVIAFVIMKMLAGGSMNGIDVIERKLSIACVAEIVIALCLTIFGRKTKKEKSDARIFNCRQYDLERILEFVMRVDILGINSRWGNGKTFLLERLCEHEKIKGAFEIIQIDLLTCNLDEIEIILMNELDKILNRQRIFSKNARRLRMMLGEEKIMRQLQDFFMGNDVAVSSAFKGFKQDVRKINKKIMIIYEDIDRITDVNTIKKIFAISEKLAGQDIGIIYQYDQENLKEIGLERGYLEKYIPHVVNLTDMDYKTMINELWDELNMAEEKLDKEEILNMPFFIPQNYEVKKMFGSFDVAFELEGISVRKVRIFMEEINYLVQQNKEYQELQNRITLIRFLFIKHFYYHIYEELEIGKQIEETLKFRFEGKNYTMSQLLYMNKANPFSKKQIEGILSDERNKEHYAVLLLFEYGYDLEKKEVNRDNIANESIDELKKKEKTEKVNRMIWNLLGNGKSEFTNMQNAIKQFVERILSIEAGDKESAWKKYKEAMFHQELWKDNGTIFRIGINEFLPIFQGFRIWEQSEENWLKLLEFYDYLNQENVITVEFVENLNNCNLHYKRVFLQAMELFCKYKIVGNMNKEKCFLPFLKNYLQNICWLGYSRRLEIGIQKLELSIIAKNSNFFSNEVCDEMIELIEKEKERLVIREAVEECELIQQFIRKINCLMTTEQAIKPSEISFNTSVESIRENQQEYDRLYDYLQQGVGNFRQEVEKSYKEGKINPAELKELIRMMRKGMEN